MRFSTAMADSSATTDAALPGEHVLQRIAWLTVVLGLAAAAVAAFLHRPDWAKGIVCGTVLGWLNFRWLKRGMLAMVQSVSRNAASQSASNSSEAIENRDDAKGSAVPTYLLMAFRYILLALGVYVIFTYLHVPLVSIGLGLCALGAATIAASVWEVAKPAS
ncbi:MAG TPA: ATP synthase subunit I [Candidatus Dormibacteraeota bacterium]|jgi:hypothetical protein|nr:ATP synthase subunit I [Candidatus Dormibacteraeota bacterium]